MDRIDTNSEKYISVAKDTLPGPTADMFRELVAKINEIIDWINNQS